MKNSIPYYFVSAEEYSRQTKIGVEEIKKLCRLGKIENYRTEGGYYKIKVFKDGSIPKEQYEEEKKKRIEAETTLQLLQKILLERR